MFLRGSVKYKLTKLIMELIVILSKIFTYEMLLLWDK